MFIFPYFCCFAFFNIGISAHLSWLLDWWRLGIGLGLPFLSSQTAFIASPFHFFGTVVDLDGLNQMFSSRRGSGDLVIAEKLLQDIAISPSVLFLNDFDVPFSQFGDAWYIYLVSTNQQIPQLLQNIPIERFQILAATWIWRIGTYVQVSYLAVLEMLQMFGENITISLHLERAFCVVWALEVSVQTLNAQLLKFRHVFDEFNQIFAVYLGKSNAQIFQVNHFGQELSWLFTDWTMLNVESFHVCQAFLWKVPQKFGCDNCWPIFCYNKVTQIDVCELAKLIHLVKIFPCNVASVHFWVCLLKLNANYDRIENTKDECFQLDQVTYFFEIFVTQDELFVLIVIRNLKVVEILSCNERKFTHNWIQLKNTVF